jgi:uncharacterized phage-associated protein
MMGNTSHKTDSGVYKSFCVNGINNFEVTEKFDSIYSGQEYKKDGPFVIKKDFPEKTVSVFDVACYILSVIKGKSCTTMKLHKLLYYCQAWSMVWVEKPIFSQKIEAWANGPVIKELFYFHKGLYSIHYSDMSIGNEKALSEPQKSVVDDVLNFYGDKDPQWLIDLTHFEDPWREARKGMDSNERGNRVITLESMQLYYSSLQ